MSDVNPNMLIDVVDGHDKPMGVTHRRGVFSSAANFRVVHVLIFNPRGELLLQQLASTRDRHPGFWGSSVAGYLFASEDYAHAAARRLGQELGIHNSPLEYVGKTTMNDSGCTKFIGVFRAKHDGPFPFDHSVIQRLSFERLETIHQLVRLGERSFTPTFLHVFQFYQQKGSVLQ